MTGSGAGRARAFPVADPHTRPRDDGRAAIPTPPHFPLPPPPPPPAKACLTGGAQRCPCQSPLPEPPADKGGQPAPSPKPQAPGPQSSHTPPAGPPLPTGPPCLRPSRIWAPKHPIRGDGPDFPGAGGRQSLLAAPRESIHPRRGGGGRCGNSLPGGGERWASRTRGVTAVERRRPPLFLREKVAPSREHGLAAKIHRSACLGAS